MKFSSLKTEQLAKFKARKQSWSSFSSFMFDPEQWYKSYILGEKPTSKEMDFGKEIGKKLETDPTFLPQIPRLSKMEHGWDVVFSGIPLCGYADSFCVHTLKKIKEYKTGKKVWDQKRVDEHGQLTMYALLNFITNKVKPEDTEFELIWMPTEETGDFQIKFVEPIKDNIKAFKTKRTTAQMLQFGAKIKDLYRQMEQYIKDHE